MSQEKAVEGAGSDATPVTEVETPKEMLDIKKMTPDQIVDMLKRQQLGDVAAHKHKFWSTQPVVQEEINAKNRAALEAAKKESVVALDKDKTVEEIRQEPYNLPKGFEWCTVDIDDENTLVEAYTLLSENYVEDDDNMFRFDYSPEFLKWALRPPGFVKDWIIGVRKSSDKELLALITGIPAKVHTHGTSRDMAEINFLCVHKSLRTKRLAPVLIKEVTRRVNLTGRWQAVYTAGVVIPTPFTKCRYYHRSINPAKLIAINFSALQGKMTMKMTQKLYKLPDEINIEGFRPMEERDVPQVTKLLKKYLSKFKVWIEWNQEEISHWLLPRDGVVNSYVVARPDGKVTDMCSFYHIPSTVIGHEKYKKMSAAYSFYNVATTVTLTELMQNSLVMANKIGVDVMNCLDLMDNKEFLDELKFGKGDGYLNYYLFNLKCPPIETEELGIVLL